MGCASARARAAAIRSVFGRAWRLLHALERLAHAIALGAQLDQGRGCAVEPGVPPLVVDLLGERLLSPSYPAGHPVQSESHILMQGCRGFLERLGVRH